LQALLVKYLITLAFTQEDFPDLLKIAKVVPIFKSDDKLAVNNYHPGSVLPAISKILERLM